MKPLKESQKLRIAYANGVRTIGEYAIYRKRIRGELPRETIESHMNRAIDSMVKQYPTHSKE